MPVRVLSEETLVATMGVRVNFSVGGAKFITVGQSSKLLACMRTNEKAENKNKTVKCFNVLRYFKIDL